MTAREERIERLVASPPKVVLTPMQRVERAVAWLATVIAITALVLGVANLERTAAQSQCTNRALGYRASTALQQDKAAVLFATADQKYNQVLYQLIFITPPRTHAQIRAARALFKVAQERKIDASKRWTNELAKLVRIAETAPLGQC